MYIYGEVYIIKFNLAFCLVFTFITSAAFANGSIYTADEDDTLKIVIEHDTDRSEFPLSHYEVIKAKIIRFNPHVKNWNKIPEDLKLYLSSPLQPHISSYKNAFLKKACALNREYYEEHGGYKSCLKIK